MTDKLRFTLHQQLNSLNEREIEIKKKRQEGRTGQRKHQRTEGLMNNSQCQKGMTLRLSHFGSDSSQRWCERYYQRADFMG